MISHVGRIILVNFQHHGNMVEHKQISVYAETRNLKWLVSIDWKTHRFWDEHITLQKVFPHTLYLPGFADMKASIF